MAKKTGEFSYDAAMQELQTLVNQLQNDQIGVDSLAEKVKQASDLIKLCRQKLRQTEIDVNGTLEINN
ncbi:MAG: exodeoxyribonuclease VII small subunit [Saprospiraceae bacterium]|nr:exodeoxyribonuclease VII small subunit [Saprospiraceae bacterium]